MKSKDLIKLASVIKFANKVSPNSLLEIVPVKVEPFSIINNCYDNVKEQVQRQGGSISYGWTIHEHSMEGRLYTLEAEAHAIWKNIQGKKTCISPQSSKDIIFLEDNNNVVQHNNTIPNYRTSLVNDDNYMRILELKDYIKIEITKYINLNITKLKPSTIFNLENISNILIVHYNNQKYIITDSRIIKMYEVSVKINQMEKNPFLLTISGIAEELATILNYQFKYLIKI